MSFCWKGRNPATADGYSRIADFGLRISDLGLWIYKKIRLRKAKYARFVTDPDGRRRRKKEPSAAASAKLLSE